MKCLVKNLSLDSKRGVRTTPNMEGEYGSRRSGRGAKVKKKDFKLQNILKELHEHLQQYPMINTQTTENQNIAIYFFSKKFITNQRINPLNQQKGPF